MIEIRILFFIILYSACTSSHPYFSNLNSNPYNQGYGLFSYGNEIPYNGYLPSFQEPNLNIYLSPQHPLNLIAETPQIMGSTFSLLPIIPVSQQNVNMVSSHNIMGVSAQKPMLTVKTEFNSLLQCIPGVKIELEQPMWIYALEQTNIIFPSEISIYHGGYKIPLKVGAILAPVTQDSFFFNQVPFEVRVIYAVPDPSKPIRIETVTTTEHVQPMKQNTTDNEAIVVDSNNKFEGEDLTALGENPKNVTVVHFSDEVASPTLPVSEDDEELVNRNPPQVLVPAGIVQSTQPQISVEAFHNSKESPVLTQLKQEKLKQKLKIREVEENKQNVTNSKTVHV